MKIFVFTLVVAAFVFVGPVFAQTADNVKYPVAELGGCKDKTDCKAFCEKQENLTSCMSFAKENSLMSDEEITLAKKFSKGEAEGPGGCKDKESCEEYCNSIDHIDECVEFGEKNNLMKGKELAEAKKMREAIKRGVKPPPCKNKKECDAYCESGDHMQECIEFATQAGFMEGKELEDAQKMLQALKKGVKPPPCKGKEECDTYCQTPENMEVCINFAMEAGFMTEEEKTNSQKMLQALKKGVKPPPCKGKEECDTYCQSEEHMQECIDFSVAAGMMSEEDAQMAKKTGGKGPGGCKSKEECDKFCQENQEACFNFAKENGMMPEEELKRMEEGKAQMMKTIDQMPAEVADCLKSQKGEGVIEKIRGGMISREVGDAMQGCFEKFGPMRREEGQQQGQFREGPGGCKSPEECKKYCEEKPEECNKFQPSPGQENPGGQMMPQQAGPGGCKSPEECKKYCEENPQNCGGQSGGQNGQPGPCQGENCQNMQPGTQGGPSGKQIQIQPGNPVPCEGENCKNMQPGTQGGPSDRQFEGQPGVQMAPCQGENCQNMQQQGPQNQQFRPEDRQIQTQQGSNIMPPQDGQPRQDFAPPPSGGGNMPPPGGDTGPRQEGPPAPGPTSHIINTDSFAGSLLYAAFKAIFQ